MFKSTKRFLVYAALAGLALGPTAQAYDDEELAAKPTGLEMAGDALIARPLMLGATILGTGVFLVSLPFSALGGNVDEAGETLVANPARATFVRCLGCVE